MSAQDPKKKGKRPEGRRRDEPAFELIKKLESGELRGRQLHVSDRCRIVAFVGAEGAPVTKAAHLLGMSERHVFRYRAMNRKEQALKAGPGFAAEFAGEMVAEMRLGVERARRAAQKGEPADAIEAERVAGELRASTARFLIAAGFVPSAQTHGGPSVTLAFAGITAPPALPPDPAADLALLRQVVAESPALAPPDPPSPTTATGADAGSLRGDGDGI